MDLGRIGWRKATYSSSNGGNCIEVGNTDRSVAVRDTKDPDGPKLGFEPEAWRTFVRKLKNS